MSDYEVNEDVVKLRNALKDKRICVTGAEGFLGRHLVASLEKQNYGPVFIVKHEEFDLTKWEMVERLFEISKPDVVFHLAAVVGGIGANRVAPGRFFYENLIMGAQMLECARLNKIEKFIQVGTICSYPKFTSVPFKEEDLWNGYPEETNAPYGVAKKALLVQGQAYREQYGLNCIYLLPTNLYGPGDNFAVETSHVIPALIRKFIEAVDAGKSSVEVWGTGRATREFLYVTDAAEGIIMAAEKYDGIEPINLGTSVEISIRELSQLIAELVGFNGEIIWDSTKPDGQPRRSVDTSRAYELFGFRAHTSFMDGLRQAINWYRNTLRSEYGARLLDG